MSTSIEVERPDGTVTRYRRHPNGRGLVAVGAEVHGTALVANGAYIEPGAQVAVGAQVYDGAWIEEGAVIDAFAVIGSGARVGRGAEIGHHARIGSRCVVPAGVKVRPADVVRTDLRPLQARAASRR